MKTPQGKSRRWMRHVLVAAGIYHIGWAALGVFFPAALSRWTSVLQPGSAEACRALFLTFGILGAGFLIAALDPLRHWLVVLVGLLDKLIGPASLYLAARSGPIPWTAGATVIVNDLVWWAPFALILHAAYREHIGAERVASPEIERMALRVRTQLGLSLDELSRLAPVLLVFLRHPGCPFCREALADLALQRRAIESRRVRIALVHMSREEMAGSFFRRYGVEDLPRVSDPRRSIYRAFGLGRGDLLKLFGPGVWIRAFQAAVLGGHGIGRPAGDNFQMPGVFLVFHGEVLRSYRHQSAADRPDYLALASEDLSPAELRS